MRKVAHPHKHWESIQHELIVMLAELISVWKTRIFEFLGLSSQIVTTAREIRTNFFEYAMSLLLLAISGGLFLIGATLLIWTVYETLAGRISPLIARATVSVLSLGAGLFLVRAARNTMRRK
jgi:hypothetical protein